LNVGTTRQPRPLRVARSTVSATFGSPAAVAQLAAFHDELVRRGLGPKPALVGISRGGLYAHRYASEHPGHVAVIYGDAGVCDFKSWPGGKGKGKGSPGDWKACLAAYGFADEAAALAYQGNPIDTLAPLAKAGVALIHVVGDADDVVPPAENAAIVEQRYRALGGTIKVIHKERLSAKSPACKENASVFSIVNKRMFTA
jgi:pimeloyl-ACP methyl ester carboxylesterase